MDAVRARFLSLHEIVEAARQTLDRNKWDFLIGGTETETTVRRNRMGLDCIALEPRILRNVVKVDVSGQLLGQKLRIPVVLAPIGSIERFDPDGAAAVAEAAQAFGCGMLQSSVAAPVMEESAKRAPDAFRIFQLYVRGDSAWIDAHVDRLMASGYRALCLTVDSAHYSRRERDISKRYSAASPRSKEQDAFQAMLDWNEVARLKTKYPAVPLILKGIMTAADAVMAVEHGVDVVYISNHGGRQLDHGRGAIDVLAEVADAVKGRAEIVIDGGFCRGTDVVKAIALGADAIGIGRLYAFGLAAAGSAGVQRVLELLEDEIVRVLGLLGVDRMAGLDRSCLHAAMPVGPAHVLSAFPYIAPCDDRY
jgi:glycolate oxidase